MDFAEQLQILQAAQGNPALLALATVDLAHDALPVGERSRIKNALLAAAVPHWCDRDFLAALLQTTPEESDRLLKQLRALTVIEPFPARGEHAVNVHETARLALREYLRKSDAALWQTLSTHSRAHVVQSHEPHARIEALYHLFATDQPAAAAECEALDLEFGYGGRPEVRSALALALRELTATGWLKGRAEVEALLSPLEVRNSRGETAQLETDARRVVNLAHSASHASGIGRAQGLLGDVLQTKGRLDDALAAFREYLAIFHRLASMEPSNTLWQINLSGAHFRIGGIYEAKGRLDDALAAFRETFNISERLASTDASNTGWQSSLADAYAKLGDIYQSKGSLDDALVAFREYLAIYNRLASSNPSGAGWQRDLAVAHSRVGDVHEAQGQFDDALVAFREYRAIFERLTSTDPSDTAWQRELAVAHGRLGDIYYAKGQLDEALAACRENFDISERLASTDPSNVNWQRDLAVSHGRLGDIYYAKGQPDEALAASRDFLAISQRVASADPSNVGSLRNVALAYNRLGQCFRNMGNEEEAQSSFRSAVETMERVVAAAPGNLGWKQTLVNLKGWLG